jgi:acid stress chaperone HdeB
MPAIAALVLTHLGTPAAQAQVLLDVSKITCEQLITWSVTDPRNIAMWIGGFYNGRRNNTVIDTQSFKDNVDKVTDYCRGHRAVTVMQAVETVLSPPK